MAKCIVAIDYGMGNLDLPCNALAPASESPTIDNVRFVRPANGRAAKHLADVLGRRARVDLAAGTPLAWNMLE